MSRPVLKRLAPLITHSSPSRTAVVSAPHLAQQLVPLLAGHAAVLDVGAGELTAVIEKADVVVLLLEGLDLLGDELVDALEEGGDVVGDLEVHLLEPPLFPPRKK